MELFPCPKWLALGLLVDGLKALTANKRLAELWPISREVRTRLLETNNQFPVLILLGNGDVIDPGVAADYDSLPMVPLSSAS